ncbi:MULTISPECIES: protein kinase domain-containing protein [Streptomyces]|uniref:Protein kinase n=2 Tax=Streptomyces TaxID=1883 RepID=A0ABU4K573_9ACTN|nr:protein kinase [Streptomyces roseolus]MDX2292916.1 protein kinase [Streptomyces roseolus]
MLSPLTHDDPAAIGTYRLLARLGSGGMGTVYLGRSPGGRVVALKTLHARLAADPVFRGRFRLETDAARIIGGRHGAAVVDADPLAETPWLATEYVLGPPLDRAVRLGGPLPEPTVRALGAALAGALGRLHASDVVHRDLKPSNVLVTAYGPKIIDFGIARAAGDDHLTRAGSAAGTPAYMSPEQAGGLEHAPAGDVFALAGVLLFAATGHGPFGTGSPADLLYRVRYAEPDLSGLPPGLVPLLSACLAKDPAARPTTDVLTARLHDGQGEFADHLPPVVLADIARRATDVWLPLPERLPAPEADPYAETRPAAAGTGRSPSRRRFLALGGGVLLAAGGAGGVLWATRDTDRSTGAQLPKAPLLGDAPDSLWNANLLVPKIARDRAFPLVAGDRVAVPAGLGVAFTDTGSGETAGVCTVDTAWRALATDGTEVYAVPRKPEDAHHDFAFHTIDTDRFELRRPGTRVRGLNANMAATQLPCVADGIMYVGGATGTRADFGENLIAAVDVRTGRELWRARPVEPPREDTPPVTAAAVRDGRFVAVEWTADTLRTGRLLLVVRDARTGAVRWRQPVVLPAERICLDGTHVYSGGPDLVARRLTDGSEAWRLPAGTNDAYAAPELRDGTLYTVSETGAHAFAPDSGKRLWQESAPQDNPPLYASEQYLAVGPGHLFYRTRLGLAAVDLRTRRRSWVYQTDADHFVELPERRRMFGVGADSLIALPLN